MRLIFPTHPHGGTGSTTYSGAGIRQNQQQMSAFSLKLMYGAALALLACFAWFAYRQHTEASKAICQTPPAVQKQAPKAMYPLNPVGIFLR